VVNTLLGKIACPTAKTEEFYLMSDYYIVSVQFGILFIIVCTPQLSKVYMRK